MFSFQYQNCYAELKNIYPESKLLNIKKLKNIYPRCITVAVVFCWMYQFNHFRFYNYFKPVFKNKFSTKFRNIRVNGLVHIKKYLLHINEDEKKGPIKKHKKSIFTHKYYIMIFKKHTNT